MEWIVGTAYRNFVDVGRNVRTIVFNDSTETKSRFPGISWTEEEGGND